MVSLKQERIHMLRCLVMSIRAWQTTRALKAMNIEMAILLLPLLPGNVLLMLHGMDQRYPVLVSTCFSFQK